MPHQGFPSTLSRGPLTVHVQPLDRLPALETVLQTVPPHQPVMWLDSARQHAVTGRWSMLGYDPWLTVVARGDSIIVTTSQGTRQMRTHPLEVLQRLLRRYHVAPSTALHSKGLEPAAMSRAVGLMGYLSYDLNRWIERLPEPRCAASSCPEMVWFGMRVVWLVDHLTQQSWLVSLLDPMAPHATAHREAMATLTREMARLSAMRATCQTVQSTISVAGAHERTLTAMSTQAAFEQMVVRVLEHIRAGDVFQANVSQQFTTSWQGSAWPLYQALRQINPSPFSCFLSSPEGAVVSCSPERLVRVEARRIETRPIAGTRPRGVTGGEDAVRSLELLMSDKERAEHLMLVDLARNDLGRVAVVGSVAVEEFMTVESYSHVMHIVSQVSGRLRDAVDAVEVIRALFPGGTITGCPKVRCMELLSALEPTARGLYTGSLGFLGFDGTTDLNIAIRTMVIQAGQLSFHVGAGIVADSDPAREYHETLDKAAALFSALNARTARAPHESAQLSSVT